MLERSVCRGLRMSEVCVLLTGVPRASVAQGRLQEFLGLLGVLPPSLTPLGMRKAAVRTGCGEGRMGWCEK